jgi:magnesium chelatase family protein
MTYPARFQLIAAMNPCPCGYLGTVRCVCSVQQISRYRDKLSGPLLDRIDLKVQVTSVEKEQLFKQGVTCLEETDEQIQKRVCAARNQQIERQGILNTHLSSNQIKCLCPLSSAHRELLDLAIEKFALSTRGFYRTLKVARTIADLESSEDPTIEHYKEALSYRQSLNQAL